MGWLFNRDKRSEAEKSLEAMQARPTSDPTGAARPSAAPSTPSTPAAGTVASDDPVPAGATFSMSVEDVFSITGRGTVVTGRVESGEVRVGQPVWVVKPDGSSLATAATGIEKFRSLEEVAVVGDNVGLLLRGLRRDQVARGDTVKA